MRLSLLTLTLLILAGCGEAPGDDAAGNEKEISAAAAALENKVDSQVNQAIAEIEAQQPKDEAAPEKGASGNNSAKK